MVKSGLKKNIQDMREEVSQLASQAMKTENGKPKRLYRSGKEKVMGGVCGGMAEYLGVDPVIVRLLWILFSMVSLGTGIILYFIAWAIVPRNPAHKW